MKSDKIVINYKGHRTLFPFPYGQYSVRGMLQEALKKAHEFDNYVDERDEGDRGKKDDSIVVYFRGTERGVPFPIGDHSVSDMLHGIIAYIEYPNYVSDGWERAEEEHLKKMDRDQGDEPDNDIGLRMECFEMALRSLKIEEEYRSDFSAEVILIRAKKIYDFLLGKLDESLDDYILKEKLHDGEIAEEKERQTMQGIMQETGTIIEELRRRAIEEDVSEERKTHEKS